MQCVLIEALARLEIPKNIWNPEEPHKLCRECSAAFADVSEGSGHRTVRRNLAVVLLEARLHAEAEAELAVYLRTATDPAEARMVEQVAREPKAGGRR